MHKSFSDQEIKNRNRGGLRAALVGVTGLQNRGVEALVRPTLDQLTKRLPGIQIRIATGTPDYDHLRCPMANVEWQLDPYAVQSKSWRSI